VVRDIHARPIPVGKNILGMVPQAITSGGWLNVISITCKQSHADLFFQLADARADGGLRHAKTFSRPAEVSAAVDFEKRFQEFGVHV
jgi:hypothetical protein